MHTAGPSKKGPSHTKIIINFLSHIFSAATKILACIRLGSASKQASKRNLPWCNCWLVGVVPQQPSRLRSWLFCCDQRKRLDTAQRQPQPARARQYSTTMSHTVVRTLRREFYFFNIISFHLRFELMRAKRKNERRAKFVPPTDVLYTTPTAIRLPFVWRCVFESLVGGVPS